MAAKTAHRKKLFIEASALTEARPSGIGHSIVATIRALIKVESFITAYEIVLLVSADRRHNLGRWNFPEDLVKVKSIPLEKHILQVMLKYRFLPPMDIFIGRGIYLFPNYKNWPLLFSKSLTYIYDVAYTIFPETVQPKNLIMLRKNVPHWIQRTDKIITISETSKAEILEHLDVNKRAVDIVYCGVDTAEYHRAGQTVIQAVKKKYSITGDYILSVGSIEPRKNIGRLLDAYAALPAPILKRFSLVLIGGDGWLNEPIFKRISELKQQGLTIVHPTQYVGDEDLPPLYSGAALLVQSSIHEGFGFPPLQAMACGVPVVVSDIGAQHEVVGEAGIYFDPYSVDSIKQGILKGLDNPAKFTKQAAKQVEKFSWSKSGVQLAEAIQKVGDT
jgi:glycosyltransferase involved in cell wall biosynthesis